MTAAASEVSPFVRRVTVGELCKALGIPRSTLLRAVAAKLVPDAEERTPGQHRRWSVEAARAIVKAAGRKVPRKWVTQ